MKTVDTLFGWLTRWPRQDYRQQRTRVASVLRNVYRGRQGETGERGPRRIIYEVSCGHTGHTEGGRTRGSSPGAAFVLLSRTAGPLSRAGQAGRLGAGVSWTTPRINTDAQRLIGPFS